MLRNSRLILVSLSICIWAGISHIQAQSASAVADMHYHVSLKKYNEHGLSIRKEIDNGTLKDDRIWDKKSIKKLKIFHNGKWHRNNKKVRKLLDSGDGIVRSRNRNNGLYHYTQATVPHTDDGSVKLAFNAISPFEKNFADDWWSRFVSMNFKSNAKKEWLKTIGKSPEYTHWENFNKEYQFIVGQKKSGQINGNQDFEWDFLYQGSDLLDSTKNYVVLAVEGGHILQDSAFPYANFEECEKWLSLVTDKNGCDEDCRKNNPLMRELLENIKKIKSFDVPIKMFTIGHLSYNGMLDHAPALDANGAGKILVKRMYRIKVSQYRKFVEQWSDFYYSELGVNAFGKTVIDSLLDPNFGGSRILIDLKHSAFSTRKYYLDSIVPKYINDPKPVPPIFSHGGATGLSEVFDSPLVDQYALLASKGIEKLYPFGINLYDEEIQKILDYDGIIGLALEQRVLGGYVNKGKRLREIKKYMRTHYKGKEKPVITFYDQFLKKNSNGQLKGRERLTFKRLCEDYWSAEPFLQNLFYILNHSRTKPYDAWHHVCIGSDLDGIIDPIDICPTASQYPYFRERLTQFIPIFFSLNKNYREEDFFKEPKKYEKELDQLFYKSLRDFTQKNF